MTQTVRDENGMLHSFPDDASPDEMNTSIDEYQRHEEIRRNSMMGKIQDFTKSISPYVPQPRMPAGINIASGLMSLIGKNPQQREQIANLPQVLSQQQPGAIESGEQVVGKNLPSMMTGGGPGVLNKLARIGLAGGYGAATEPENRSKGALTSAGIATGIEALAPISKMAGSLFPESIKRNTLQYLSKGAKNVDEAWDKLGDYIRSAYGKHVEQSIGKDLQPLLNQFGREDVFKFANPSGIHAYRDIPELTLPMKSKRIEDLYEKFKSKPTFDKAQKFQSELFHEANDIRLKGRNKTGEEKDQMDAISEYRKKILNQMQAFLKSKGPKYADQYKAFQRKWAMDVEPYYANKKIKDVVLGEKEGGKNLHTAFESPTGKVTKEGKKAAGNIQKVARDLPDEAKDLIMFSKVGGHEKNAEELVKVLKQAKQKGYSSYITPPLEEQIKLLPKSIIGSKVVKYGVPVGSALYGIEEALKKYFNGSR